MTEFPFTLYIKYLLNKKYVLLLEQQNEHLGYNGFLMIEWVCLFTGKNMEKGNYFDKQNMKVLLFDPEDWRVFPYIILKKQINKEILLGG